MVRGAGICHLPPVPRAVGVSRGELSPLNVTGHCPQGHPRATQPGRATHSCWDTPGSVSPVSPHVPMSPMLPMSPHVPSVPTPAGHTSPFPRQQLHFFFFLNFYFSVVSFFPHQNPLLFWAPLRFLFPAFARVGEFGGFFFFGFAFCFSPPFSQCFYHLGEKREQFSLQLRGTRGPRMLLALCWEIRATLMRGWRCPCPPGCSCHTQGTL